MLTGFIRIAFFLTIAWGTMAQGSAKKSQSNGSPTTLDPRKPANFHAPHKKKKSKVLTYNAQAEYAKRMEAVLRKRKHIELSGAQLQEDGGQNPRFGHKLPPKIRKPGKQKYCRVCGIYH